LWPVENGIYDPERMHVLDHKGEFPSVRGPLNIARPIQGWPVIVQAGASDAGQLAAETAEMIFASGGKLADAQHYYADVRERAQKAGRDPDHIKILPGCLVVVGTPRMIADRMEEWLYSAACDAFNIMFPWVPGGLDDFVDRVVPELQRRSLFRREYEGKTLRENLGLPRPENRFFAKRGF
jgi:alkanesulfonate monooxygenase SsuD/methylene tetrahydromethanopterin reductase-like flavin-dependent oxidoreductase (luciferase family)